MSDVSMPDVIRRYLGAHDAHDVAAALATFAGGAHVHDEDRDFHGAGEIRRWLETAGREFTYTRTFVSAEPLDDSRWMVVNRLEGDFPGNVADLRYQFVVTGDRIAELVIAP
jgi:hypothetical protein